MEVVGGVKRPRAKRRDQSLVTELEMVTGKGVMRAKRIT